MTTEDLTGVRKAWRDSILGVAEESFRTQGFVDARVEDIARAAGVSRKTLFNYFKSKESLLIAVVQKMCAEARPRFPEHDEPDAFDAADVLPTDMDRRLELIHDMRWILAMAARHVGAYDPGRVDQDLFGDQRPARIHRIAAIQDAGGIRPDISPVEIEGLFEMLRDSVYRKWLLGADDSLATLRRRFWLAMKVFLDGLRPVPDGGRIQKPDGCTLSRGPAGTP